MDLVQIIDANNQIGIVNFGVSIWFLLIKKEQVIRNREDKKYYIFPIPTKKIPYFWVRQIYHPTHLPHFSTWIKIKNKIFSAG